MASTTVSKHDSEQDYRVQVTSKKAVSEQINRYKEVLKEALHGQTELPEEIKRALLEELLANFEAAVQDNVLVKGQTWDDAPDAEAEDEAVDLENLLSDTIVETTRRRRTYPKQIWPHVVHTLKAERELMGLYEEAFKPQEMVKDPGQESIMKELSGGAPGMVKHAANIMKSIEALQKQAQGLCQVINTKPSQTTQQVQQEVFGHDGRGVKAVASRQSTKMAVEETAAGGGYVVLSETTPGMMGHREPA